MYTLHTPALRVRLVR